MRSGIGYLAMICATAIVIAFLKYWTPFIEFQMHFYQQQQILDLMESARPAPPQTLPNTNKIKYYPPVTPWPLPPPDLPPEPGTEPTEI